MPTLFESFLKCLGVRFSSKFTRETYLVHPHRDSLWGIAKLLETYRVENAALKTPHKDYVSQLPTPFLAEVTNGVVLVKSVSGHNVIYERSGREYTTNIDTFKNVWNGVLLIAKATDQSEEPDYRKHLRQQYWHYAENAILALCAILLLCLACMFIPQSTLGNIVSVLLNISALYVCYLLIVKQLNRESRLTRKLCGLSKKRGCERVHESKFSMVMGIYPLAECGFAYFLSNLLFVTIYPTEGFECLLLSYMCAFPFTLWSIWYQTIRIKTVCPLCLIVQIIVWLMLFIGISQTSSAAILDSIRDFHTYLLPFIYLAAIVIVHRIVSLIQKADASIQTTYSLNRMKYRLDIFHLLLHSKTAYELPSDDAMLIFGTHHTGNPKITVLSNPYCSPCAALHKNIQKLIDAGFQIQYILTSFTEELALTNRLIISYYRNYGSHQTWKALSEWFASDKAHPTIHFHVTPQQTENDEVYNVFIKQNEWTQATGLSSTPTILIDGFPLPDSYNIEDLMKLSSLN